MKYISTPIAYAVYEVEDEAVMVLSSGVATQPPQVVLEVMVLNGQAKRIGQIGSMMMDPEGEEEESDEDEEEGEHPWVE